MIISFARVTKRFGTIVAVNELSMEVENGEMFGLIGPDGAGKTTTIRLACGLVDRNGGTVRTLGLDPVRQHRSISQTVGYFAQRFSLYGDLSIDENIAFFAEIHGVKRYKERRERLLEMMQLTRFRGRLADRLSGGMRQKLALACTLIHEPKLILLDEPTTGVDPVSRRELWKLLAELRSQGITIVISTPYLDEAERCSRVALLHEGRLVALDAPDNLRRQLPGVVLEIIALPHRKAIRALAGFPGVESVQAFGERAHVRVAHDARSTAVDRLTSELRRQGLEVKNIREVPASLEDVFIERITQTRAKTEAGLKARPTLDNQPRGF